MLERRQLGLCDVEIRGHPLIPVADGGHEAQRRQHRRHDRHDDDEEQPVIGRAVDFGGLDEGIGHVGVDERAHDDDVHRRDAAGQDEHPERVLEMEHIGVDEIAAQRAAGEEHRDEQIDRQAVSPVEVLAAERIGEHRCEPQREQRAEHGHERGHAVGDQQLPAELEHIVVRLNRPFRGEEAEALRGDACLRAERDDDHQQHRQQAEQREQAEYHSQHILAAGRLFVGEFFHDVSSFPLRTAPCRDPSGARSGWWRPP